MTEKGYFAASWGDLLKTPGWLGKMLSASVWFFLSLCLA